MDDIFPLNLMCTPTLQWKRRGKLCSKPILIINGRFIMTIVSPKLKLFMTQHNKPVVSSKFCSGVVEKKII